jgi:hypothetical protein
MNRMTTLNGAEVCSDIACELKEIGTWLSAGKLDPETFRQAILTLEDAKVRRHGFTLEGTTNRDRHVIFRLRFAASGNLCAEMEFDPSTGELETQHVCESE